MRGISVWRPCVCLICSSPTPIKVLRSLGSALRGDEVTPLSLSPYLGREDLCWLGLLLWHAALASINLQGRLEPAELGPKCFSLYNISYFLRVRWAVDAGTMSNSVGEDWYKGWEPHPWYSGPGLTWVSFWLFHLLGSWAWVSSLSFPNFGTQKSRVTNKKPFSKLNEKGRVSTNNYLAFWS